MDHGDMTWLEEQVEEEMAFAAEVAGGEILLDATNLFGHLTDELRARVLRMIAEPGCESWDDAYSVVVHWPERGMGVTVWQALIAFDPDCPHVGHDHDDPQVKWDGYYPNPSIALFAIAAAVRGEVRHGVR